MTALARGTLFLSAFLPVFPLVAIRSWDANRGLALAVLSTGALIAFAAIAVLYVLGRGAVRHARVRRRNPRAESVFGFIAGYLLPVSLIDGRDSSIVIVHALTLAFLVIVAVRSHLVYLNPVLAAFGHHVYDVEVEALDGSAEEHLLVIVGHPDVRQGAVLRIAGSTGPIQRATVVTNA